VEQEQPAAGIEDRRALCVTHFEVVGSVRYTVVRVWLVGVRDGAFASA
jgi:hypothetical protein